MERVFIERICRNGHYRCFELESKSDENSITCPECGSRTAWLRGYSYDGKQDRYNPDEISILDMNKLQQISNPIYMDFNGVPIVVEEERYAIPKDIGIIFTP